MSCIVFEWFDFLMKLRMGNDQHNHLQNQTKPLLSPCIFFNMIPNFRHLFLLVQKKEFYFLYSKTKWIVPMV
jgi:hypothetical protein